MSIFDKDVDRTTRESCKYSKELITGICGNPDAMPYWVADMDFEAPKEVVDAAVDAAKFGVFGYPHSTDDKECFMKFLKERHGVDYDPDLVVPSSGVLVSLATLMETNTHEGDRIIIPVPAYAPFMNMTRDMKRVMAPWHLKKVGDKYEMDFDELEELAKEASMLILCNPHNPSGLVMTEEELRRIDSICQKHTVTVVCDEIHADLVFPGEKHIPYVTIAQGKAATLMAPSKTFNVAGEHYSVTLFNNRLMLDKFQNKRIQQHNTGTSFFSGLIGKTCYKYGLPWLEELVGYLRDNAQFIKDYCRKNIPQIRPVDGKASFVCFWDCTDLYPYVLKDAEKHPDLYDPKYFTNGSLLSRFFGLRCNIAVNDGTWFGGDDYRTFVRFNFGTQRKKVLEALENVKKGVSGIL